MTDTAQSTLSAAQLDKLQRLRASVVGFQNKIGGLPATETDNGLNEQFNDLRLETKSLLKTRDFDKRVPQAITDEVKAGHFQKVMMPRLFAIITLGVILVLLGLGVNSIILEDIIVNTMGCLVSSAGLLLVIGAFAVFMMNQARSALTNHGQLYQHSQALLERIDEALAEAIPGWAERSEAEKLPPIPTLDELRLEVLRKQAEVWQQKLIQLEAQRSALETEAPPEMGFAIDFAQRQLEQVNQEIIALQGHKQLPAGQPASPTPVEAETPDPLPAEAPLPASPSTTHDTPPTGTPRPEAIRQARANTMDMPPQTRTETADPAPGPAHADETSTETSSETSTETSTETSSETSTETSTETSNEKSNETARGSSKI